MANLTLFLRKLSDMFFDTTDALFCCSYEETRKMINSFPEPADDFERSKDHYICTMNRSSWFMRFLMNSASLILIPYYIIKSRRNYRKLNAVDKKDAVFFSGRPSFSLLPDSLLKQYPDIEITDFGHDMALSDDAWCFIKRNIFARSGSPYFRLKTIMKFAMTSYAIENYSPSAIISYTESSFVTSLLTEYCEQRGIKYICIMHGERLYGLKLAFFRCSEYYAWDDDYVQLFRDMRCKSDFKVEVPAELALNDFDPKAEKIYDYTFYMQDETEESLAMYKNVIGKLEEMGNTVCVRPHPLYSDIVINAFSQTNTTIQKTADCSIDYSLSVTRKAVSKFSTVLYQAWYKGVDIVIDDITMSKTFEALRDLKYVMLKKPHELLSEIVE